MHECFIIIIMNRFLKAKYRNYLKVGRYCITDLQSLSSFLLHNT